MIGTTGASALFLVNLLLAGALGIAAARLASLVLRLPWRGKTALSDAALSAAVALAAAYVVGVIAASHHVWQSRVTLILVIAAASVILKYIFRMAVRRA
ncbi:MAG TPA: hypothetical protein VIL63_05740 [Terriglobales bacterium]